MVPNKRELLDINIKKIEKSQQYLSALEEMAAFIQNNVRDNQFVEIGLLRTQLLEVEQNAWQDLAMFALIGTDKDRERVRAAMYARFLRENISIAEWLNGGISPHKWFTAEEKELRKMFLEEFAPEEFEAEKNHGKK